MDRKKLTILVAGATGRQGGAVARRLRTRGYRVLALTRHPGQPEGIALGREGIDVIPGDLLQPDELRRLLDGVYGVFSVQEYLEEDPASELEAGLNLAEQAKNAGVAHFVYSSIRGATLGTGIPEIENKAIIEAECRRLEMPITVLRPAFFMENFLNDFAPQERDGAWTLRMLLPQDHAFELFPAVDIGQMVAEIFDYRGSFIGQTLELAGDLQKPQRIAEFLSQAMHTSVRYHEIHADHPGMLSARMARLGEWFSNFHDMAIVTASQMIFPGLSGFEEWVHRLAEHAMSLGVREDG